MARAKNDGKGRLGGRQKGTPNKVTGSVKEWLSKIIDSNRTQFEKDLKGLEPGERVRVISGLLPYVTPKMQSISPEELLEAEYNRLEELLEAEYNRLEELLDIAPDEAIILIAERVKKLKYDNRGTEKED